MAPLVFEDTFKVSRIDPDGKKFDKVSRIEGQSEKFDAYVLLDVNIDVYPMTKDKHYTLALATTLALDGTIETGFYNNQTAGETLADRYDYVMHGPTVCIGKPTVEGKREICFSFGGLLLVLRVDESVSEHFMEGQRLFLLMKQID